MRFMREVWLGVFRSRSATDEEHHREDHRQDARDVDADLDRDTRVRSGLLVLWLTAFYTHRVQPIVSGEMTRKAFRSALFVAERASFLS